VRNHLLERMLATTLHHIEMVGELAMLQAIVASVVELVLGCSPDETFRVVIADELVKQVQRLEELSSWFEQPGVRICDLLLRLPPPIIPNGPTI
jgi:hypothetical protein